MAPKNEVEVLQLLVEQFNNRDFDGTLEYMDPDLELNPGVLPPDQDTRFLGHEGLLDFLRGATEAWEAVSVEHREVVEGTEGRFLAIDQWRFRGRDGIEIERELPTLYTFRDGLVVRIDGFLDKADALEAAGPSP